eukprot:CAMPEP_0115869564 /NCGR_PEP_ID=MMETSP0287-20121206/21875_1 /TAXON_ID=412157 /ORGANISM="Chrysochromulina rotalis, Strain UIO044" /LENGTH=57 /DNA_ID=CAMNT_0003324257 /DNA_START=198 /DNA_END=368 /DNA_ORIENTATION=-
MDGGLRMPSETTGPTRARGKPYRMSSARALRVRGARPSSPSGARATKARRGALPDPP